MFDAVKDVEYVKDVKGVNPVEAFEIFEAFSDFEEFNDFKALNNVQLPQANKTSTPVQSLEDLDHLDNSTQIKSLVDAQKLTEKCQQSIMHSIEALEQIIQQQNSELQKHCQHFQHWQQQMEGMKKVHEAPVKRFLDELNSVQASAKLIYYKPFVIHVVFFLAMAFTLAGVAHLYLENIQVQRLRNQQEMALIAAAKAHAVFDVCGQTAQPCVKIQAGQLYGKNADFALLKR